MHGKVREGLRTTGIKEGWSLALLQGGRARSRSELNSISGIIVDPDVCTGESSFFPSWPFTPLSLWVDCQSLVSYSMTAGWFLGHSLLTLQLPEQRERKHTLPYTTLRNQVEKTCRNVSPSAMLARTVTCSHCHGLNWVSHNACARVEVAHRATYVGMWQLRWQ